jgi:hypothetical protein
MTIQVANINCLAILISGQPNAGHQRRARTAASDKPCMRDMLIARPLHAIVRRRLFQRGVASAVG